MVNENMLDDLKINLEREKEIISKMELVVSNFPVDMKSFDSLKNQLKILNRVVPVLLARESGIKKLSEVSKPKLQNKNFVKKKYSLSELGGKKAITLEKKEVKNFSKELKFSESSMEKLRKQKSESQNVIIKKPSQLARVSNLLFSNYSLKLSSQLPDLSSDLKKANMRFMPSTYISISLLMSSIVFIGSLLIVLGLSIINLGFLKYAWVPFVLLALSIIGFYLYPSTEKSDVEKRISNELPFATIYMSAIASSNMEPSKLFRIIAMGQDYPQFGLEMKKLINQIDIYGYDIVSALKNASKSTPNKKLSELFGGLATNIVSGGSLKNYLDQKADNFLTDYKLERQKYTALAETFMDVYISILITAPMILIMLVVIMNITGMGGGWNLNVILTLAILGVAVINVFFMFILKIKQPVT